MDMRFDSLSPEQAAGSDAQVIITTRDEADRVDRVIARLKLCAEAGADSLYPVGRH